MPHDLPSLPYAYDALEPHYDAQTLMLHHDNHHASYVKGLNAVENALKRARETSDFSAIQSLERRLAFHASGHILHSIFWTNMCPNGGGCPDGELLRQIERDFESFQSFQEQFKAATVAVEGSGWGILAWNRSFEKLQVLTAQNHQHVSQWSAIPLLVCDVWEHAYYLKYHNRRVEWVEAFFDHLLNWQDVAERFAAAVA